VTAARNRAWIPETASFAIWSSSAFLFYLGTFVMLFSILWLLESLNGGGSDVGLVGWASLGLAALVSAAVVLLRAGMSVLAGLAAFLGLIVFAVWVGALEDWLGFFPDQPDFFSDDFEIGFLVLEAVVVAVGLLALRIFRFPLLMLPVAAFAWFAIADNAAVLVDRTPGEDAHALSATIAGLLVAGAGVWLDRQGRAPYAFWLHVVGGLTAGAGLLELLDHGDWRWYLAGLIALLYVAAAHVLARSSYAVIGAIGVLWVGSHFIDEWLSTGSFPLMFFSEGPAEEIEWKLPLAYGGLGLILVVLGVLLERGRRLRPQRPSP
jgi:hypothetical protein